MAKGVLWRCTNPDLPEDERQTLVRTLMDARRAVKHAETEDDTKAARAQVHEAKVALGERGPVWWQDGAPDYNRRAPKNTPYADWWAGVQDA